MSVEQAATTPMAETDRWFLRANENIVTDGIVRVIYSLLK